MLEYSYDIMRNGRKVKVIPEGNKLWLNWADLIFHYDMTIEDEYIAEKKLKFKRINDEEFVSLKGLRTFLLKMYHRRENLVLEIFSEIQKGIYPSPGEAWMISMEEIKRQAKNQK